MDKDGEIQEEQRARGGENMGGGEQSSAARTRENILREKSILAKKGISNAKIRKAIVDDHGGVGAVWEKIKDGGQSAKIFRESLKVTSGVQNEDDWFDLYVEIHHAIKDAATELENSNPLDVDGIKSFLEEVLQKMDAPPCRELEPRRQHYIFADCTLAGDKANVRTFGREEAEKVARAFLQRSVEQMKTSSTERNGPEWQEYDVLATWATTGGGKTHMIHRVAQQAESMGYKAITITFNIEQKFTLFEEVAKPPPCASLCARIIFSAFRFGSYQQWENFCKCYFGSPRYLGVQDVVTVLRLYREIAQYNEQIFVGVDELVKLQGTNVFSEDLSTLALLPAETKNSAESILPVEVMPFAKRVVLAVYREVLRLVDTDQQVRILFSTLDSEPIRSDLFETTTTGVATQSANQCITWLMLDPLSAANGGIEQVIGHWQSFGLSEHMTLEKLQWLAGACGGHARSLDFAGQALSSFQRGDTTMGQAYSLADVFARTVDELTSMNATGVAADDSVLLDALAHCILSRQVSTSASFGAVGKQWTCTDLIKHGWLINAAKIAPNYELVPQLSLLMGYHWAKYNASAECNLLLDIIGSGSKGSFEHFHTRMELLRRWAYLRLNGVAQDVVIEDWYEGAIVFRSNGCKMPPPKLGFACCQLNHLGDWHLLKQPIDTKGAYLPSWRAGMMVAMHRGQSGCDGCLMVENSSGTRILVVTESRLSNNLNDSLTVADIHEKTRTFRDCALPHLLTKYDVEEENVVYVVAALNNLSETMKADLSKTLDSRKRKTPEKQFPGNCDALELQQKSRRKIEERQETKERCVVVSGEDVATVDDFATFHQFKGTLVVESRPVLMRFYSPTFGGLAVPNHQSIDEDSAEVSEEE